MAPLTVPYPATSTLESRCEGGGDSDQDQVPLPFFISSSFPLQLIYVKIMANLTRAAP